MTTTQLAPSPVMRLYDNLGNLAIGGLVYTYAAGTSTPATTYTDSTATTPNANPVVANSRGEVSIWLATGKAYKLVAYDASNNLLWSKDQIAGQDYATNTLINSLASSTGSTLIAYNQGGAGAINRTQQSKNQEIISVKDFGAAGDGVTDDTAAIQAALNAMSAVGGGVVTAPRGQYLLTSQLTIPSYVLFLGASWLPDPSNGAQTFATSLYIKWGAGNAVGSGNQAVTLSRSSGIEGFTFFYPGQVSKTASTPVVFDFSISTPTTGSSYDNCHVKNITLYNSYVGVNLSNGGRWRVENIQGNPLAVGFRADQCFDVCYMNNVHFWNFYTQSAALETWVAANGIAFDFRRIDQLFANDMFGWNYNTCFSFTYGAGAGFWGSLSNLLCDKADSPLVANGVSILNISNFVLIGSAAAKPAVQVQQGGTINLSNGVITSATAVGVEVFPSSAASVKISNTQFKNQHSALVDLSGTADIRLDNCSWNVPPFGGSNVKVNGERLGDATTQVALPTVSLAGNATTITNGYTFPLTTVGTAQAFVEFDYANMRSSLWVLQFNYNLPVPSGTWYFQILVQTTTGTFVQVAYAPQSPMNLNSCSGGSTGRVTIPIHAGYTQYLTNLYIQVVTTAGVVNAAVNITNLVLSEQANNLTTDSQVAMYLRNGYNLDAYSMGQCLYAKGKNRKVITQSQTGFKPTEVPISGAWAVGDEVSVFNPTAGGYQSYICTIAGTPGTWKGVGLIQA